MEFSLENSAMESELRTKSEAVDHSTASDAFCELNDGELTG